MYGDNVNDAFPENLPHHPKVYMCPRAPYTLEVSGEFSDPAWDAAPYTDDFVDIEGEAQRPPWLRTRCKMLWDDEFFYIGVEMEEPHLWATLTEHDSVIFQDNDFEVFIDPDSDNHNYFEFEVNALGTTWDLRLPKPYRAGGSADNSWEIPGMKLGVKLKGTLNNPSDADQGWTLELAFPWSAFKKFGGRKCPPEAEDVWRVNFSRVEWDLAVEDSEYKKIPNRPEHNWVWSPQLGVDMHRPWMWGYVQFTDEEPEFYQDPHHIERMLLHQIYMNWRHRQESFGDWFEGWSARERKMEVEWTETKLLASMPTTDGLTLSIDETSKVMLV